MRSSLSGFALAVLFLATPLMATPVENSNGATGSLQPQHWECVPIARALSGIEIRGNADTWWRQAEGKYDRGDQPKRGAVLTFKPYGPMTMGHVAAVSRVVDNRTILVTHSNWSRINGKRGQIERDVRVIDVSKDGDWSAVRVWYAPNQDLGTTVYPVHGFIYPAGKAPMTLPTAAKPVSAPTLPVTLTVVASIRPTGRLDYLAKMLRSMR